MKSLIGSIHLEHWRDGQLLDTYDFLNDVTNVGKNALVDAGFNGGTPGVNWYLGLINASNFFGVSATDTMAGHPNWFEWVATTLSARPIWTIAAASSNQVQNTTPIHITLTNNGAVKGVFLCNDSTLGGTTGLLWATALLTLRLLVNADDYLILTYNVEIANQ